MSVSASAADLERRTANAHDGIPSCGRLDRVLIRHDTRRKVLAERKRPSRVRVHRRVPQVRLDLVRLARGEVDAGGVDEAVEATECLLEGPHELADAGLICVAQRASLDRVCGLGLVGERQRTSDIENRERDVTVRMRLLDLAAQVATTVCVLVCQGEPSTLSREVECDSAAYAGGAAAARWVAKASALCEGCRSVVLSGVQHCCWSDRLASCSLKDERTRPKVAMWGRQAQVEHAPSAASDRVGGLFVRTRYAARCSGAST